MMMMIYKAQVCILPPARAVRFLSRGAKCKPPNGNRLNASTVAMCKGDLTRCRAIAGRTARCRYKFRHNGIVHAVTVVQHGFLV